MKQKYYIDWSIQLFECHQRWNLYKYTVCLILLGKAFSASFLADNIALCKLHSKEGVITVK